MDHHTNTTTDGKMNLLIGVTGSVAAIKLPHLLVTLLALHKYNIRVIMTSSSEEFITKSTLSEINLSLNADIKIYTDVDERGVWKKKGDPVLHIDLRKWADIMLIAPLSANSLAKISNGLCDNLLTCVVRAWDFSSKWQDENNQCMKFLKDENNVDFLRNPIIVAPAMNTLMYENPITAKQLNVLKEMNYIIVEPVAKILACGDQGKGALADISTLVEYLSTTSDMVSKARELDIAKRRGLSHETK